MLVRARIWINENFEEGSRPKVQTVKSWIEKDKIDGKIINGVTYVARYQAIQNTLETTNTKQKPAYPLPTSPALRDFLT